MKIYPGRHSVIQTSEINLNTDIPLAYIDTGFKSYKASVIPEVAQDKVKKVVPYTSFDSMDVCLFDEAGVLVESVSAMQRDKDKYIYNPPGATSFSPQRFAYTVTGKKNMTYKSDRTYNMKAACMDLAETMSFAKSMIKVFGDAPVRGLCPANISINDRDVSVERLVSMSYKDADFVFVESPDGKKHTDNSQIDFNAMLAEHANVWVSVDTFPYPTTVRAADATPTLINGAIYKDQPIPKTVFDPSLLLSEDGVVYHDKFNNGKAWVVIKEYVGKGFVIMTPKDFLLDVQINVKLLYEVLVYVYLNTYAECDPISEWITDVVPDYIVVNNELTNKTNFISNVEIHKILGLESTEVSLANVTISPDNVKFAGMSGGFVTFRKDTSGDNQKYADPPKPAGATSVFTPRQNVIFYKTNLYEIEDATADKISCSFDSEYMTVTVKPFRHSTKKINFTVEETLFFRLSKVMNYKEVEIKETDLYLCCKENILALVDKVTYANSDGIIIAEIKISQSENFSNVYDMRQRGGGLKEDADPVQSLLDIGNIQGVSYRKAGTVIITLPKKLEPYEEMVTAVVRKHMAAEELPIILFEDKE